MADVVRIHPHRNVEPAERPEAEPPLRPEQQPMTEAEPPKRGPEPSPPEPEPLWREALGRRLRAIRQDRDERLVDVAERAGMSVQYLSEVERGIKEPSSEMIAAVTGALGVDLVRVVSGVAGDLARRGSGRAPARGSAPGPVLLAA